jgi:chemotaxis protein MotA
VRVDKASFSGLLVAIGGILLGLLLEGGSIGQIVQPTAAMIVFGGTIGAVLLQFPLGTVFRAVRSLAHVFMDGNNDGPELITMLVRFASQARRAGILSLDAELEKIKDPFLHRSVMLAVDGTEPQELRHMMEMELDRLAEQDDNVPAVFESAGGFSPTVGIIGAVLGLIQVMQHLQNIDEVGRGIAVAFVATIYGVGAANLFFLPAAGKLKIRLRQQQMVREMTLEGVASIIEGMNPHLLQTKLSGFIVDEKQTPPAAGAASEPADGESNGS